MLRYNERTCGSVWLEQYTHNAPNYYFHLPTCGCPVIVSENTGAAEAVNEGKCGFVVPIRSSKAIVDKLNLLSEDRELLNKFSNNALKFARNNTWDNYVNKLDDLILEFKENKLQNF